MKKIMCLVVVLMVGMMMFGVQSRLSDNDTVRTVNARIDAMREAAKDKGHTFEIGYNDAMQYSLNDLCTFNPEMAPVDAYMFENNEGEAYYPMALPTSYMGYYTPIKNQGSCGSCWAFGMTAMVESTAKRLTGTTYDLSEQYVLDCTSTTWGCNGGFFNFVTFISPNGARAESCLPYIAKKNRRCSKTCPIVYQITNWAYVGNSSSVPSVDAIKTAIYTYGAVAAAVYVDSYWQAYVSGCFNGTAAGSCNHAIELVGWDDSICTTGAWKLKNSWGTGWGEAGFMWIKYNSQLVGYAACYSY
jgi:hypothetical protein